MPIIKKLQRRCAELLILSCGVSGAARLRSRRGEPVRPRSCYIALMKKSNPGARGSVAKGKANPKEVDEYLAGVPEPARSTLQRLRAMIRAAAPREAVETIRWRMPMFKYKGLLVGFAAFSNHCSFFPMSASVIGAFKNELKGFSTSKGTIRFPVDKPPPAALVKKIVKARIAQSERKKRR